MDCKLVHINLIGFIEQSLPDELFAEVNKHIGECAHCQALFQNVNSTYNSYEKILKPTVNPFIYTRIEQRLHTKRHPEIVPQSMMFRRVQSIAATVLILVGVSLGVFLGKNLSGSSFTLSSSEKTERLNAYAAEYNLTSVSEENYDVLLNNE